MKLSKGVRDFIELLNSTSTEYLVVGGAPPNRIDIITGISGVGFDEAWSSRQFSDLDGAPVSVIGREVLLKNKRASGRPKDLLDVEEIERLGQD